ncbi:HAD family hydrolase [Spiroplasma platyhelix]|uniref:HAD family phosphatase n=1 Tax=Spiroplasma platyhelix PALS-1 TaxID=1276218 RepID=A0A846TVP1_9MOLU|nr:HAD family hydrolase [Spiroplasma platyhelix]MBE4703839.1 5-amino-6-(5-phospho-D-ribitylamino)uracil phosphatase YcsE [Spiroplasma platyhelix PALS-1]NKE38212.1 HAD family phosphatase [Spiroplasma platyhelix PALS-1]UJB29097.1 HAD superfamily hydrolase [Spiroplasma platyhelix PALS-1]
MSIKLIVLDLDGTLLKSKWKVHPENVAMIKRVYQEKPEVKVVIATGRAPISTIPHARACLINEKAGHIICYNGGSIIDLLNNKQEILFEKALSNEQGQKILNFAKENKLNIWGYATDNQTAYINHRSLKVLFVEYFNKLKVKKIKHNELPSFYKILLFCKNKKQVPKMLENLDQEKDLELATSSHSVIEVNPIGINKATAVEFLAKKWNIQPEEILACGDGMNDYKLLEWVKYGIAMDNAPDELKKIAYGITASNTEAGVAKAIQKYLFS